MKTKFLQLMCLTSLLGLSKVSNAQYKLVNGAPFEHEVVKEPLFHWDLIRFHLPSFIRQSKHNTQQFINTNQMLQTKDESGRFNFLQTSIYNPNTQEWVLLDKHDYTRNYETGYKTINEVKDSYLRPNVNAPLTRERTVTRFYYNGDNPIEVTEATTDGNSTMLSGFQVFFIYENNVRISDTIINSMDQSKRFVNYTYNNLGQCTMLKSAFVHKPDSLVSHVLFSYLQDKLSGLHVMIDNDTLFSKQYTYQNNKLTEVKIFNNDNLGNLKEADWYKHGYNNEGKLQWVASFFKQGNNWSKDDSIYFNHVNNKVDTSYGFLGSTTGWNPNPYYRFIFDNTTVGLMEQHTQVGFDVRPNPASNLVNISLHENSIIKQLEITDLLGKTIYRTNTLTDNQLDVSMLKTGVYLLKINTENGFGMKKLVIN
jgi:hypothetical protein